MPDAAFLETYPLYRKFPAAIPNTLNRIATPRINMDCDICRERRTFTMENNYWDAKGYVNAPSDGETIVAKYRCASCDKFTRWFFISIAEDLSHFTKIGQQPAWSIRPDQNVENMLGIHKSYLSKGLICESQSYGIGAFSYYRRITEEIIDILLDDIADMIPEDKRNDYESALNEVKKTRVTAEKIDLVKELLPSVLRPKNMNPLALLHGVLSEGLHAQSDERCLELAVEVREILTFLASQVAAASAASKTFSARMKTLLDKRSGR